MTATAQQQPQRIPPGKEWAFRMVAAADAGYYTCVSNLPLKWAREVVAKYSKPTEGA